VTLMPHAPCRVRLLLTEGTLARLDRATLRALLAHEIAHMQLSHPEARLVRVDAQKQTEKEVKTASRAASKAAGFIPGVGGLVSKGIGTARKGVTAAMEMHGAPYLARGGAGGGRMAVALPNENEASNCRVLARLLEERLRAPDDPRGRRGRARIRCPRSGSTCWRGRVRGQCCRLSPPGRTAVARPPPIPPGLASYLNGRWGAGSGHGPPLRVPRMSVSTPSSPRCHSVWWTLSISPSVQSLSAFLVPLPTRASRLQAYRLGECNPELVLDPQR
jgi:peptidase M48-like protein